MILGQCVAALAVAGSLAGCRAVPIVGKIEADANVAAAIRGTVDVHLPPATDPGPVVPVVVRGGCGLRVAQGRGARRRWAAPEPEPDGALLGG